jgi:hypothetical protein
VAVAGSDAHTLACLGKTYTEVPGAGCRSEFLAGLKQGRSVAAGESGSYWKLTRAVWTIGWNLMREHRWAPVLAPLLAVIPAVTMANLALELAFAWKWGRRTERFSNLASYDTAGREILAPLP